MSGIVSPNRYTPYNPRPMGVSPRLESLKTATKYEPHGSSGGLTSKKKFGHYVVKPAIGAVIGGGIAHYITYPNQWVRIGGFKTPRGIATGGAVFVGQLLADAIRDHGWMKVGKGGYMASMMTEIALIAGADFLIHLLAGGSKAMSIYSPAKSLIQALAASATTTYAYDFIHEFVEK